MRTSWNAICLQYEGILAASEEKFKKVCEAVAALKRFGKPTAIVEYLTSKEGDQVEKNSIYVELVRAVQSHAPWADLAIALLWCGLWPGLNNDYRILQPYFRGETDDLVQELWVAFATRVGNLGLHKPKSVAKNLVWSPARDVMDKRTRELRFYNRGDISYAEPEWRLRDGIISAECESLWRNRHDVRAVSDLLEENKGPREESAFWIPSGLSPEDELRALHDAGVSELLLSVVVGGETEREAAERLGLGYDAARKRVQREKRKLLCPNPKPKTAFPK